MVMYNVYNVYNVYKVYKVYKIIGVGYSYICDTHYTLYTPYTQDTPYTQLQKNHIDVFFRTFRRGHERKKNMR